MDIRYSAEYPFGDNYPPGMSEMDYRYVGEMPAYHCKKCNRWLWRPCKNCKNSEDCFCDGFYKNINSTKEDL